MSNIDYIINLCFDISEQGKTPSVALIRNMAHHPLAIPEVIKGLQHWKSNSNVRPKIHNKQISTGTTTNQSLQQRVSQLEAQVATIMQQLTKMSDDKSNTKGR
jgi:predicted ATP-grasp superfamily ATP-dependent carboligase